MPAMPETLIQQTAQAFDGLDILITNAGGPPPGQFDSFDDSAWQKAIELSLMSHVRLIRAALPWLRKSSAASVLAITSYSVKQPIPNLVLSNSIRAATVGLIKTLALELGADGIRFNSILPAWTETERVYALMENRARANGTSVAGGIGKTGQRQRLGPHGNTRGVCQCGGIPGFSSCILHYRGHAHRGWRHVQRNPVMPQVTIELARIDKPTVDFPMATKNWM